MGSDENVCKGGSHRVEWQLPSETLGGNIAAHMSSVLPELVNMSSLQYVVRLLLYTMARIISCS
jgi:hypothetical protein